MNSAAHHDRYGLPLSTSSAEAAEAYREGVDLMFSAWTGAAEAFERAITLDPDFALAQIGRARIHVFYQQGDVARAKAATARDIVARHGTLRERSHVETLALAIEGRGDAAIASVLGHVEDWPRDAVVLSLPLGAFGLFAFSGMADHDQARQDLCERYASHYGDDWWFLSSYGWAMTENGAVARGRAMTERGFAMRRDNAHAAHALLHAMFEDGSVDDADALVEEWAPGYDRDGILYGHILWHQALGALERDDAAKALAIYRNVLAPQVNAAPPLNVVSDCSALLWRLSAYGHAVPGELWREAEDYAKRYFPKSGLPFVDVHMALLAAATGDNTALEARLRAIEQRLSDGKLAAGPAVPQICRAMQAFAAGDARGCATLLEPVLDDVVRIGGSHAQREIVEDTLIVALIRTGDLPRAREFLDRRLHRRPSPRDVRWRAAAA
ncbi:tetratricopeptide repeat protein [Bradyrhizobium sp. Tv2a-2]|uniref:tetratricopeptide repeat protein n=1 Tax=Bradyrhizobium sp. Tv2a-2 TaxID=113395 RepID=UPI0004018019|nr:tetratricopeptide repeat protein [Bradyrhizobium sp. Tv2a-2]